MYVCMYVCMYVSMYVQNWMKIYIVHIEDGWNVGGGREGAAVPNAEGWAYGAYCGCIPIPFIPGCIPIPGWGCIPIMGCMPDGCIPMGMAGCIIGGAAVAINRQ